MSPAGFSHSERLVILAGLMLGMFLAALDQTIVATALPGIAADLNGAAHLSWVVAAYLLTTTAATPIYGKLSDFYGRKIMLQIAIVLFVVASILCALAPSMAGLIAARALQGIGGGGLISMAHATIADIISPRERGRYQGYLAGVWGAAAVAGPLLGGLSVDYLDWRWIFWINLPIGLGALVLSQLTLRGLRPKREPHRIDYAGSVLIVGATACALLVTTMGGNEFAWGSRPILALATASLLLFGACIVQERHAPEPMIPPRLFRNRIFVLANLYSMLGTAGTLGAIVFLPLFLQLDYGLSASASGFMLVPFTIANVVGAITAGRMIAITGRYRLYPMIGLALATFGSLLLAATAGDRGLIWPVLAASVAGVGTGSFGPSVLVSVQNTLEPRELGAGTAAINFFRALGGAFGAAVFGAVLLGALASLLDNLPSYYGHGSVAAVALIRQGPAALAAIPPEQHAAVRHALNMAFGLTFGVASVAFVLALIVSWFVEDRPLLTTSGLVRAAALSAVSD